MRSNLLQFGMSRSYGDIIVDVSFKCGGGSVFVCNVLYILVFCVSLLLWCILPMNYEV